MRISTTLTHHSKKKESVYVAWYFDGKITAEKFCMLSRFPNCTHYSFFFHFYQILRVNKRPLY